MQVDKSQARKHSALGMRVTGVLFGTLCLAFAAGASAALRGSDAAAEQAVGVLAAGASATPAGEAQPEANPAADYVVDTTHTEGSGEGAGANGDEGADGYKVSGQSCSRLFRAVGTRETGPAPRRRPLRIA